MLIQCKKIICLSLSLLFLALCASQDPAQAHQVYQKAQAFNRKHSVFGNKDLRKLILEYFAYPDLAKMRSVASVFYQGVADTLTKEEGEWIGWLSRLIKRGTPPRLLAFEVAASLLYGDPNRNIATLENARAGFNDNLLKENRRLWDFWDLINGYGDKSVSIQQQEMQHAEAMKVLVVAYDPSIATAQDAVTQAPLTNFTAKVERLRADLMPYAVANIMCELLKNEFVSPVATPPTEELIVQWCNSKIDAKMLRDYLYYVRAAHGVNLIINYNINCRDIVLHAHELYERIGLLLNDLPETAESADVAEQLKALYKMHIQNLKNGIDGDRAFKDGQFFINRAEIAEAAGKTKISYKKFLDVLAQEVRPPLFHEEPNEEQKEK